MINVKKMGFAVCMMNSVFMALYHKYRPQKFSDIISQEHIIQTLENQVKNGKLAHAYLFSGPRGIGKTTTARLLAKAANCPRRKDGNSEPCNECGTCQEIAAARSIDVLEMDAASHTQVEKVREHIIESVQFHPTKSKFKIFIIDEAHMLSDSSFNALLKTLEEPPAHVIFILATTELRKLPETIISRCQRFAFRKIPREALKKYLSAVAKGEGVKIDKEVLERIINKSDGAARDAISLLDQIMATGEKHIDPAVASLVLPVAKLENILAFISALIARRLNDGLLTIAQTAQADANFSQFGLEAVELLRLLMLRQAGAKTESAELDASDEVKKELDKLGRQISRLELVKLIDLLLARRAQIKTAPLPQLPLEMAVIEWCAGQEDNQQPLAAEPAKAETNDQPAEDGRSAAEPDKIEKSSFKDKVKSMVGKTPSVTLTEVEGKWPEFMGAIDKLYPSLAFILKMAEISGAQGNAVQIAVGFDFHRDKLLEKRCHGILEKLFSDVMAKKIKFEVVVREKNSGLATDDEELKKIASSLGGEIIN